MVVNFQNLMNESVRIFIVYRRSKYYCAHRLHLWKFHRHYFGNGGDKRFTTYLCTFVDVWYWRKMDPQMLLNNMVQFYFIASCLRYSWKGLLYHLIRWFADFFRIIWYLKMKKWNLSSLCLDFETRVKVS